MKVAVFAAVHSAKCTVLNVHWLGATGSQPTPEHRSRVLRALHRGVAQLHRRHL